MSDFRVRVPAGILFRELDEELVLLNPSRGTYFSLNPTGTRVWQLIQTHSGNLQKVLESLLEEYAAAPKSAEADLTALTRTLCEHGLLEYADPSAS